MAVADFDRDGRPDLATADYDSNRVTVLRNNGNNTFSTLATPATGSTPASVAVGDYDRDGRPDLATADNVSGRVTVRLNTTAIARTNAFVPFATPDTGNNPGRAALPCEPWRCC